MIKKIKNLAVKNLTLSMAKIAAKKPAAAMVLIATLLFSQLAASQSAAAQQRGATSKAPSLIANLSANLSANPSSGRWAQGPLAAWLTPSEQTDYRTTPRYQETMAFIRRVAAAAPGRVKVEPFGKTGEGRELVVVIVSRDGQFDPAALHRENRPIVLVQNAIHAGEMDGKDACLALLRDMVITRTKASLTNRAVLVFIPIYNADGHERFGRFNRINQNGPEEAGWRTNATNLNLNRDYLKADAPETRAWLRLWNRWLPDFFVDDHVTDGADYQFDTTYSISTGPDVFPPTAAWTRNTLIPYLEHSVSASGHLIAPYVSLVDDADPAKGATIQQDVPRFSTGYGILQNRPSMLVEMHMLKDYKTRVTGNYELLRALLEVVNQSAEKLVQMNRDADASIASGQPKEFPLRLEPTGATEPWLYRGYETKKTPSAISGTTRIEYTHTPRAMTIPRQNELGVTRAVSLPAAYIIPAQWRAVIDVLNAHGVRMQRTARAWTGEVETYRCQVKWQERPFEGHHVVSGSGESNRRSGKQSLCRPVKEVLAFPAGSAVIPLAQRAAKVAIHWLEPEAPDSALAWGFFDSIFEQKEYGEGYVLEKLAREMLIEDPKLKAEFSQKVANDPAFAASPEARLNFFYNRSPWRDEYMGRYPVGRLQSLAGIELQELQNRE